MSLIPDLEVQLRDAASHRRERARRRGLASVAMTTVAAAAVAALLTVGNDDGRVGDRPTAQEHKTERALPVGTVIPKGEGTPPRDATSTVVATGTAPVAGPWQLEVWRSHGGPSPPGEPPGRCLFIQLLDPPGAGGDQTGLSGFCGGLGFRKTPGFSRAQKNVEALRRRPDGTFELKRAAEVLVYGRVPEQARQIVITSDGGRTIKVEPGEGPQSIPGDFFVIPVKPGLGHARINWIDEEGKRGSRGIGLMPPITSS